MGKKKAASPQVSIIQVKGSPEWRDWFCRLAEHSRVPGVALIDVALRDWARRNGFDEPPPKR